MLKIFLILCILNFTIGLCASNQVIKIPENISEFVLCLNRDLPENLGGVIQDAYINIAKDVGGGQSRKQGINRFFNNYLDGQPENNKMSIFMMKEIISPIAFKNKGIKTFYQKLFSSIILYDFIKIYQEKSSPKALFLLTKLFSENTDFEESFSVEDLYVKSYKTIFAHKKTLAIFLINIMIKCVKIILHRIQTGLLVALY